MNMYELYGDAAKNHKRRLQNLTDCMQKETGLMPDRFFSSPGRAEILGNHTDHNHGKVLVASVTCDILAAVKKRDDDIVEIRSQGFSPVRFSLDAPLAPNERERGKSVALAKGVLFAMQQRKYNVGGFTAYTASDVFRGAGVSSSAAFEVLIAQIENALYCGGKMPPQEKAAIGQYAENVFFGKPCGLLDQSGIAYGGLNRIDFADPLFPESESMPLPKGYTLVLTNTGGSHAALTEHYAAIRAEMCEVAKHLQKTVLREVPYGEFMERIPFLKSKGISDRAILRAMHFFDECARVDKACAALRQNKASEFLAAVTESGNSSMRFLQNTSVPGETAQPIVLGVALSEKYIRDGAVRVHGGGFAGTILAVVAEKEALEYAEKMKKVFGGRNVFVAAIRPYGTTEFTAE